MDPLEFAGHPLKTLRPVKPDPPIDWPERPALLFLQADGTVSQIDRADLAYIPSRDRAVLKALLEYSLAQLRETETMND